MKPRFETSIVRTTEITSNYQLDIYVENFVGPKSAMVSEGLYKLIAEEVLGNEWVRRSTLSTR